MKKLPRTLLITLFLLTLVTPLLILSFSQEKTISELEKRPLAIKPEIPVTSQDIKNYPKKYENWFNDHFGMRESFVKLYNRLFISIFHSSPTPDVIVGKAKWLFLASQFVAHDFMGLHLYPKERLTKWKKVLQERQQWLENRGIHYLWLIPPNKIMVYPEYLPDRFRMRQGQTFLEQFQDYLHQKPEFDNTIDLLDLLLHAKKDQQIYYFKGDTHWNSDGAYVAYQAIIEHLGHIFPELTPCPKAQLIRQPNIWSGGLTNFLNLRDMYQEKTSKLSPLKKIAQLHDKLINISPHPASNRQHFRIGKYRIYENPGQKRTAIFISDSFGDLLRPFLTSNFKKTIHVKDARFEDITHLIDQERPDVVIDLNVERAMYISLGESVEVRDEVMAREFRQRRGTLPVDINGKDFQKSLRQTSAITLANDGSSRFSSTGKDPQLYFELPNRLSQGILSLHCSLEAEESNLFKLYYQTPKNQTYQEKNCIYVPLHKGKNDIYLRIFKPIQLHSLRLDPGEKKGNFRFISFKLFEEK